jgi:hypothetical protein
LSLVTAEVTVHMLPCYRSMSVNHVVVMLTEGHVLKYLQAVKG